MQWRLLELTQKFSIQAPEILLVTFLININQHVSSTKTWLQPTNNSCRHEIQQIQSCSKCCWFNSRECLQEELSQEKNPASVRNISSSWWRWQCYWWLLMLWGDKQRWCKEECQLSPDQNSVGQTEDEDTRPLWPTFHQELLGDHGRDQSQCWSC